jgi:hypothetical protein
MSKNIGNVLSESEHDQKEMTITKLSKRRVHQSDEVATRRNRNSPKPTSNW